MKVAEITQEETVTQTLEHYRNHLKGQGKADATVASYLSDVKRFLDHHLLETGRTVEETERAHVTAFLDGVRAAGLKPATFNKLVNCLSCFFGYLAQTGRIASDRPLVVPKRDRVKTAIGSEGEVTVLTDRQVGQLTAFLAMDDRVPQRDRLMVLFMLHTGCRVSEAVGPW